MQNFAKPSKLTCTLTDRLGLAWVKPWKLPDTGGTDSGFRATATAICRWWEIITPPAQTRQIDFGPGMGGRIACFGSGRVQIAADKALANPRHRQTSIKRLA